MAVEMLRQMPVDLEPKRQNRWVLEFADPKLGIQPWMVQTAGRPKMTINKTGIPYMNTTTFVAGKFVWDSMTITFVDPIGPSATQLLHNWILQHAESATGLMGLATEYKKTIYLKMLDPAGFEVEKWVMEGCMIETVDFGELDYGSDELVHPSVTIQPDRCILSY